MLKIVSNRVKTNRDANAFVKAMKKADELQSRINEVRNDERFNALGVDEPIEEELNLPVDFPFAKSFAVVKFGIFGLAVYDDKEIFSSYEKAARRAIELPGPHIVLPIF